MWNGNELTPIFRLIIDILVQPRVAWVAGTRILFTLQFCYTTTLAACRIFCLPYFIHCIIRTRDPYFYVPLRDIELCALKESPCRQRGLNSAPLGYNVRVSHVSHCASKTPLGQVRYLPSSFSTTTPLAVLSVMASSWLNRTILLFLLISDYFYRNTCILVKSFSI